MYAYKHFHACEERGKCKYGRTKFKQTKPTNNNNNKKPHTHTQKKKKPTKEKQNKKPYNLLYPFVSDCTKF